MKTLPRGQELHKIVTQYGISRASSGDNDWILQERLLSYLESKRNSRMWIIALISAITSFASACAAWLAVAKSSPLQ